MLGARVVALAERVGLEKQELAKFLGFSPSAISKWLDEERTGKNPGISAAQKRMASLLHWSLDYVDGAVDVPWAPAVGKAQNAMRRWALGLTGAKTVSRSNRLAAAWEHFRSLVPTFEERVWLMYLRWRQEDWARCLSGDLQPSAFQIEAAADITGIPDAWFMTGDVACLSPISDTERRILEEYMAAENAGPDDLLKAHKQMKNPRA